MRFFVVADGPIDSPKTNSGVARGISSALARRHDVELVGTLDSSFSGWRRACLLAATFRPSRRLWWAAFNLGLLNIVWRSGRRDRAAASSPNVSYVLQVRNIYLPSKHPYLVFIDSTSVMANRGWKTWRATPIGRSVRKSIETRQFENAAHVFTAGAQAALSVVNDYGIPPTRVTAVGGGVNFDPLPAEDFQVSGVPTILWVGLDFKRKGGEVLLEAFARLRKTNEQVRLLMVGVHENAPHPGVEFIPPIESREELASIYRRATVFCLPAHHEPYGLVVQEAMAFGLPCVVTRVGALGEIVSDGVTGLLVDPGDPAALTDALLALIDSPEVAATMGRAGREKVERELTWDAVAGRMIAALNSQEGRNNEADPK